MFPPTSDISSNTILATCLSHDSSGSSSNGSSTAFSFTDSAYASSQSPPPPSSSSSQNANNASSQSISIMRAFPSQQQQHPQLPKQHIKPPSLPASTHSSILAGLTTSSPSSSLSSVHSTTDCSSSTPFSHKQQTQQQDYHYNYWNCPGCQEAYKQNRAQVLQCFHSLCETCIEKFSENENGNISCPLCGLTTMLAELLPDYTIQNNHSNEYMLSLGENSTQYCTACKSSESMAVAKCFQCSSFLCHQCVCAHQIMNCFEGHRVSQYVYRIPLSGIQYD